MYHNERILAIPNGLKVSSGQKAGLAGFAVFSLSFLFCMAAIFGYERVHVANQISSANYWANSAVNRIESRIEANLAIGRGLALHVAPMADISQSHLDMMAHNLIDPNLDVRHLAIAPGLTIKAIFPLEGNQSAVGLNYLESEEQKESVLKATQSGQVHIDGPMTLVQGIENQLIGRVPVFRADGSVWGVISVVIDFHKLIDRINLDLLTDDYHMGLRRAVAGSRLLWGEAQAFSGTPVVKEVRMYGTRWEYGLSPIRGWGMGPLQRLIYVAIALLMSAGLGVATYSLFKNSALKKEFVQRFRAFLAVDPLTGLTSRYQLNIDLTRMLEESRRTGDGLTVMIVDIDHFKEINDSLGHAFGDDVLCQMAALLKTWVRQYDLLARLSGDEFLIALKGMSDPKEIEIRARTIITRISDSIFVNNKKVHLTASIGVSSFPQDADTADTLIQSADLALSESKYGGRNTVCFFRHSRRLDADRFVSLSSRIKNALKNNEFQVYFQPIYSLDQECISHCEALCRWITPDGKIIPPSEFIPIAESCGLMPDLGYFVLKSSFELQHTLQKESIFIDVSVNRSPAEFHSDEATRKAVNLMRQFKPDKSRIIFEITESLLMSDYQARITNFWRLRKQGYQFAIDDFGTGYSSINYLRKFPVELVKIDQSFIREVDGDNAKDQALVQAMIKMSSALGLKTVAEGVETQGQLNFLYGSGCSYIQGYILAKPLPEPEFIQFLKSASRDILTSPNRKSAP